MFIQFFIIYIYKHFFTTFLQISDVSGSA